MEDYLQKLSDMIRTKKISQFSVFPDDKTFKIIKKDKTEINKTFKANPAKYETKYVATVTLSTIPNNIKRNDTIFSIAIDIYLVEDGRRNESKSWGLLLKYRPNDLEEHPFKMKLIEKMIQWVYKKQVTSGFDGLYYDEFEKKLDILKNKYKKKASRTKSSKKKLSKKRSLKRSSNKYSLKRQSKKHSLKRKSKKN